MKCVLAACLAAMPDSRRPCMGYVWNRNESITVVNTATLTEWILSDGHVQAAELVLFTEEMRQLAQVYGR